MLAYGDDPKLNTQRCRDLSEGEFLELLNENCKNFSFSNDQLYRGKVGYKPLQLFTPNYRNATKIIAFPKFFNRIENDPDYPVLRKKSLIGGTKPEVLKILVGVKNLYTIIPYDNSEIVFCPVLDLWAMDDNRRLMLSGGDSGEKVNGVPVNKDNFIMVKYTNDFKIPMSDLKNLPMKNKSFNLDKNGVEFFTSSPCLLIYDEKLDWLRKSL
jgi:hypothetical protein